MLFKGSQSEVFFDTNMYGVEGATLHNVGASRCFFCLLSHDVVLFLCVF